MCGIWGFATSTEMEPTIATRLFDDLFKLSESRGKEAAGIAVMNDSEIKVFKRAQAASQMIRTEDYKKFTKGLFSSGTGRIMAIGHSRLVTNGTEEHADNNQPIAAGKMVTVHNGIIVNADELWGQNPDLKRKSEVDTEIFVELGDKYIEDSSIQTVYQKLYTNVYGMASTLSLFGNPACMVAATNNGSLYYCISTDQTSVVFASEGLTLKRLLKENTYATKHFMQEDIQQLKSGEGCVLPFGDEKPALFSLTANTALVSQPDRNDGHGRVIIVDMDSGGARDEMTGTVSPEVNTVQYKEFEIDDAPIRALRRCTCCVLPETMPFIEFDEDGVCNYCKTYKKQVYEPAGTMEKWADSVRRADGMADSIVAFSGGRDSSYGLHYFVKELGLHPVAFSYDWGMVTDLARRNQSRMCASLGIELVLISADIRKKRDNIRRNVLAWLKKPDLGMVPLFMAGDKHYFYYANKVRKEYGLNDVLMASNPFEKTHFKSGFCGVKPAVLNKMDSKLELEQLRLSDVIRMAGHYAGQYITNPSYFNRSLFDTAGAAISYYAIPHNYFRLYSYIPWDEKLIDNTLISEYDWEKSCDTDSTWRIGDGTAPFYNYIYYLVAGFTENDTLRSNQIREGSLSREEALQLVYRDNQPRFDSMQWYFDVIHVDMQQALRRVNEIPKLYK